MATLESWITHHVGAVFLVLWVLSYCNFCHPVVYFIALLYLYLVHERYKVRFCRNLRYEHKIQDNQRRVFSESETVQWLNHVIEKIWPVSLEQIVSQKILPPILSWLLQKYKPWTAKEVVVQHLYLGKSPPMFTEIRLLHQSMDDDHLVFELGVNFHGADDMSALLAMKLRKGVGVRIWEKFRLMDMQVEGNVLIGVKFLHRWPFIGRLRVCFVEPPYFQMDAKRILHHGVNTGLQGIGPMDTLLDRAFGQTLVAPNMLVIDVEKFVSPQPENWFYVDEREPVAYAKVEVIEARNVKPSDLNGLASPYVEGHLGHCRFSTKVQRKTLNPKWYEEFNIPICTLESDNVLTIEVRDRDVFVDNILGVGSINISKLGGDGMRHEMWLSLQNTDTVQRLRLAITLIEVFIKENEVYAGTSSNEYDRKSLTSETFQEESFSSGSGSKSPKVVDKLSPIEAVWVHQPGSEVSPAWEPRKRKGVNLNTSEPPHAPDQPESEDSQIWVSRKTKSKLLDTSDPPHTPDQLESGDSQIWVSRKAKSKLLDASDPPLAPEWWEPNALELHFKLLATQFSDKVSNPLGAFTSTSSGSHSSDSSSGEQDPTRRHNINSDRSDLPSISSVIHKSPRNKDKSRSLVDPVKSAHANLSDVNLKEINPKFIQDDNLYPLPSFTVSEPEGIDIPEGNGPESQSKGHVNNVIKIKLKHMGTSVCGSIHGINQERLRKSEGDSESPGREPSISAGSDCCSEENFTSSIYNPTENSIPAVSSSLSSFASRSPKSEKHVQMITDYPLVNIVDVRPGGSERQP